ncbi:hypothetical protein R3P38DRAFT_2815829 [Favolaschia claudopus]|uniref:Uncharacterized protein n=1 Tax=Favolaschia claudopus TaxID=2862362 RepID=A0AAV9Z220_9AGAR
MRKWKVAIQGTLLLVHCKKMVNTYMTVTASERARHGDASDFVIGEPWAQASAEDAMDVDGVQNGDTVLANTILRLRDRRALKWALSEAFQPQIAPQDSRQRRTHWY